MHVLAAKRLPPAARAGPATCHELAYAAQVAPDEPVLLQGRRDRGHGCSSPNGPHRAGCRSPVDHAAAGSVAASAGSQLAGGHRVDPECRHVLRVPMLASPNRSPYDTRRGAAATVDKRSVGTAERRPLSRRLPCCVSQLRRRPHPAEPAADQPRWFRVRQGSAARAARQRALDRRRFGVAGSGGCGRAWERRPRWTAHRGHVAARHGGPFPAAMPCLTRARIVARTARRAGHRHLSVTSTVISRRRARAQPSSLQPDRTSAAPAGDGPTERH